MSVVVAFKEKSRVLAELWLLVATALFFSSTVSAPALAQTVPFNARLDFAVEAHPTFVAAGDLNGDRACRAVSAFAVDTRPFFGAAGDFNGDRMPDLAVANFHSNTVSVLLGNGDGTFQAPLAFGVGPNPHSVAAGDFNGDGKLDLV